MKTIQTAKVGEHITLLKSESGIWHIRHPNKAGQSVTYSTGVRGSVNDVKRWVKEENLQAIIEVGMRTLLTTAVINQLTSRKKTWAELAQEWRGWMENMGRAPRTVERNIEYLQRVLREMKIDDSRKAHTIKEQDVFEWINYVTTCRLSTRKTMLQAIRSAWNFFRNMGYVDRNVVLNTGIRMDKLTHAQKEARDIQIFTPQQFKMLASGLERDIEDTEQKIKDRRYNLKKHKHGSVRQGKTALATGDGGLRARLNYQKFFLSAINLSYGLGLRISDCAQLVWDSLLQDGWIIVHTEKTNARIAVPYMPDAINEFMAEVPHGDKGSVRKGLEESAQYIRRGIRLMDIQDDMDAYWCFPYWKDEYQKYPYKLSQYFKRILNKQGMTGRTFHSLRHSRIRRWKELGITLEQIGRFVGHADTKTTEGYL